MESKNAYQSIVGALERARKLYRQLDEENRRLVDQNNRLKDCLTISEKKLKNYIKRLEEEEEEEELTDPNDTSVNS
ncbi:hypothetical protein J1N35_018836 [Gossypium stocksii]|uniref:Uncharacterized protein n=1 Tax=Gossypium stocksii TaxID=47602 RepID=A0A9D3VQA6_9ROSI|nr:hypothetical protein J1N35_018836 [Gossypium stocksii]